MNGFKGFNKDVTCRGMQYEVGKTYKIDGDIALCERGFHFCKTAADCANYYNHGESVFAEVEAIGKIIKDDDKCVTDEITIVRVLTRDEFCELANNGKNNMGIRNTGNRNTGHWNTGDCNTGNRNAGDWNTGHRNATNYSAGFFCTDEQTVKIFDIDSGMTRDELVDVLPSILRDIPFGYYWQDNKLVQYTAQDRQKFYDGLDDTDKRKIKSIPHFDADKFEKCTGIKVGDK